MRGGGLALLLLLLLAQLATAHPVAQGQLEVRWQAPELHVEARISNEQILIASSQSSGDVESLEALHREHADYLLAHLQVHADDRALHGRLVAIAQRGDFVTYRLSFPLARAPQRLTLRQDLLNEIAYAPANPWEASFLVRSSLANDAGRELLLASRNQPLLLEFAGTQPAGQFFAQFAKAGVRHILSGYDHLLFVSALTLAAFTLRRLMMVIAAFTLAHSITLVLSSFALVRLPSAVVEPMIAGSIIAVALANLLWPVRREGWTRLLAAFVFGLFHGLGFAGGLLEAAQQLAAPKLVLAVASFSAGVEFAHLLVVIPLFCILRRAELLLAKNAPAEDGAPRTLRVGSALVALAGAFYLMQALP